MNAKPKKKKRTPIEMALVWGGIVLLVVVLVVELAAKLSYSKALDSLETKFEQSNSTNPLLVQDALALVKREPDDHIDDPNMVFREIYTWKWFSLFRTYQIRMYVKKADKKADEMVIEIHSGK